METVKAAFEKKTSSGLYMLDLDIKASDLSHLAQGYGFHFFYIDGSELFDRAAFIAHIKNVLQFPSYFGGGWDALLDCLRDLSWLPSKGYVLLYDRFENLAHKDELAFQTAIHVMKRAAEFWNERMQNNPPMYIFLKGDKSLVPELEIMG